MKLEKKDAEACVFRRPAETGDQEIWYFPVRKRGCEGFRAGEEPSVPAEMLSGLWGDQSGQGWRQGMLE